MATEIDLREVDRRARMALHQDGLDEILVGLSLGIMAVFFLDFRLSIALVAGCVIQIVVKPACRRTVTYPRVGYARQRTVAEKATGQAVFGLAVGAALVGLGLLLISHLRWFLPAYLGIVLATVTFAQAWPTPHIYDYFIISVFLLSGLAGLLLISLGHEPSTATAIQGWGLAALLIPVGIIRFGLFLQKYPNSVREENNGHV